MSTLQLQPMLRESRTLLQAMEASLLQHSDRSVRYASARSRLSFGELHAQAQRIASGLLRHGAQPGSRVGLLLPSCVGFLDSFLGTLFARAVAVPLPPPAGIRSIAAYAERLRHILVDAEATFLIIDDALEREVHTLLQHAQLPLRVLRYSELLTSTSAPLTTASPTELALIQYTSGSTSHPKGVPLTHDNLFAGLGAALSGSQVVPSDVTALWLPLHHDMGLIGALSSLLGGLELVLWSPLDFVRQPYRWLKAFAEVRGSIYAGPSFSYQSMLRYAEQEDVSRLDLSAWRVAFNGAEVIDVEVMQAFTRRFAAAGFRPEVMLPVYGLAEATLAVCFPKVGTTPQVRWFDPVALANEKRARRMEPGRGRGLVSVGQPVRDHEIRLVDESGRVLQHSQVGEIQVRGPAVMRGYLRKPDNSRGVDAQGWLSTGDLGFTDDVGLFVTGRKKEMIIVRGHNYYPQDVERAVASLAGIYRGRCVALCANLDGIERMAVAFELDPMAEDKTDTLVARIRERVLDCMGLDQLSVHPLPPQSLPRTTSGKYQRLLLRERLESAALLANDVQEVRACS